MCIYRCIEQGGAGELEVGTHSQMESKVMLMVMVAVEATLLYLLSSMVEGRVLIWLQTLKWMRVESQSRARVRSLHMGQAVCMPYSLCKRSMQELQNALGCQLFIKPINTGLVLIMYIAVMPTAVSAQARMAGIDSGGLYT